MFTLLNRHSPTHQAMLYCGAAEGCQSVLGIELGVVEVKVEHSVGATALIESCIGPSVTAGVAMYGTQDLPDVELPDMPDIDIDPNTIPDPPEW